MAKAWRWRSKGKAHELEGMRAAQADSISVRGSQGRAEAEGVDGHIVPAMAPTDHDSVLTLVKE